MEGFPARWQVRRGARRARSGETPCRDPSRRGSGAQGRGRMTALGGAGTMDFRWPGSRTEIERIHLERKRLAVERALQSRFWKKRMPALRLDRLDDPEEWRRIPVLTKEDLRQIPPERFHEEFCIQPRTRVVEYWRSGGATGRPLFYPRTAEDMHHNLLLFERAWALIGA